MTFKPERSPELVLADVAQIAFTEAADPAWALKRIRGLLSPQQSHDSLEEQLARRHIRDHMTRLRSAVVAMDVVEADLQASLLVRALEPFFEFEPVRNHLIANPPRSYTLEQVLEIQALLEVQTP